MVCLEEVTATECYYIFRLYKNVGGSQRLKKFYHINCYELCRMDLQSFVMTTHVYLMFIYSSYRESTMDFNSEKKYFFFCSIIVKGDLQLSPGTEELFRGFRFPWYRKSSTQHGHSPDQDGRGCIDLT